MPPARVLQILVALGLWPAVEGARLAARERALAQLTNDFNVRGFFPLGETPGSTAGQRPAATNATAGFKRTINRICHVLGNMDNSNGNLFGC